MYRKRLVCASHAGMNITEDQTRRLISKGQGNYTIEIGSSVKFGEMSLSELQEEQ
jgi:hypothetical protein